MSENSWIGSNEGRMDEVLAPWTPIKMYEGKHLKLNLWGRTYEFADMPFPSTITTQGVPILTGPIRLTCKVKGKSISWKASPRNVLSHTPAMLELEQSAANTELKVNTRTTIDFDGLIRVDLKLESSKPITIDGLVLEIPISRKCAKYLYSHPNGFIAKDLIAPFTGKTFAPEGRNQPTELPFFGRVSGCMVPLIWLGTDKIGLELLLESDRNWYNSNPDEAVEILCEGERVLLRLKLIDKPVRLFPHKTPRVSSEGLPIMETPDQLGQLDYTFAFQATPVKPVEKTCWDYRIVSPPWYGQDYWLLTEKIDSKPALDYIADKGAKCIILWNWTDIITYTKPVGHEKELRELVKEAHKRGLKILVYIGFQICEAAPEWPEFGQQVIGLQDMENPSRRNLDLYPELKPNYVNRVCYNSVWQDFLIDGIANLVDDYDIDGVYLDATAIPRACKNTAHGCGYINPNGETKATYPIFAVRETMKRMYAAIKSRKPDGLIDAHVPAAMYMPSLAWTTSYWSGETLSDIENQPITDVLPLDYFRIEAMGFQWGIPAEFLHYTLFRKYDRDDFRKSFAIPILHDVPVRAHISMDDILSTATPEDIRKRGELGIEAIELVSSLWQLFDEFGKDEAEWLPYWDNKKYIKVEPEGVYASIYKHPKNGIILIVSNLNKDETDAELSLNLNELGLSNEISASDGLTGESIPIKDSKIQIRLKSLEWKAILLSFLPC